jgi:phage terminase large subunit GpA-like protein
MSEIATYREELLQGAADLLVPLRDWEVHEWAEEHIRFGPADSHLSDRPDYRNIGRLDVEMLAYVKSLECEKIVNRSGTQSGKTTLLLVAGAYWMQVIGTNGMWLLPTIELVDRVPRNRLLPTLRRSRISVDIGDSGGSTLKQCTFHGGQTVLRFLLANEQNLVESPAALILVDEPEELDSKGYDLLQLAESRFRTFKSRRKLLIAGTPKKPSGAGGIIDHYDASKRFVPEMACPRCGQFVVWEFEHFKWDGEPYYGHILDKSADSWAECPECGGRVEDEEWTEKVFATARWRDLDADRPSMACGFWKRAYETAFETPRTCVAEYLKTKDNPLLRRAFLNSWLGEVRTDENDDPDAFTDSKRQQVLGPWAKGIVPAETFKVTWGIDVGSPVSHAVGVAWLPGGRAHVFWSEHMSSSMSEWRRFEAAIDHLQKMSGLDFAGKHIMPSATAIDSGYNTSEIYKLCRRFKMLACRGSTTRMKQSHTYSRSDSGDSFVLHDHFHWQSYLDSMLTSGRITIANNESDRFFRHLSNERLVHLSDKNGRIAPKYEKVSPRADNHFRDALVLALMIGSVLGYDDAPGTMQMPKVEQKREEPQRREARRQRIQRSRGLRRM